MRKRLIYLLATLVFNTAIGGLLTLLKPEFSLRHNLVFAHCIGLTFALASLFILGKYPGGRKRLAALVIALPICVTIGVSLAFITDLGGWHQPWTGKALAIGLFFCLIGTIALLLAERIDAEIKQRQLLASESEKRETEAHLKLLQAQIEPHFLFNTLANLSSLIDSDPALAKSLLERLKLATIALARARSGVQPSDGSRCWRIADHENPFRRRLRDFEGLPKPVTSPSRLCCSSRWWKTPCATASNPNSAAEKSASKSASTVTD
jgi:hypothetical protein